jgi:hypothetical protein
VSDLRAEFERIYKHYDVLTPQLVVDEWRSPKHQYHDRLEWDNRVAGESYRRIQAHELIRSVRVIFKHAGTDGPQLSVRKWHAVRSPVADNGGFVYEPAEKVAEDPLIRAIVLRDMQRDWEQLKQRYAEFEEFIELIQGDSLMGKAG